MDSFGSQQQEEQLLHQLRDTRRPWLRAEALLVLLRQGRSRRQLQAHSGLSPTQVRHELRVAAKCTTTVKSLWARGKLSYGHVRILTGYPAAQQEHEARTVIARRLSVHALAARRRGVPRVPEADLAHYRQLEEKISNCIGYPVSIAPARHDPRAGTLSIRYTDLEGFDGICHRLRVRLDDL